MTPLKPCPFCGGAAKAKVYVFSWDNFICVACEKCKASTETLDSNNYPGLKTAPQLAAIVARKWNRRAK